MLASTPALVHQRRKYEKKIVSEGSETGILKGLFIRNLSDIMMPY